MSMVDELKEILAKVSHMFVVRQQLGLESPAVFFSPMFGTWTRMAGRGGVQYGISAWAS